ncbi:MAG: antitoxin [Rhizobium sp.]|nr:antitoxin [Rhizobium sp.]
MSRLTIDITDLQHQSLKASKPQSLKALAALQGKTIKQYALERLFPGDIEGERAWEELKTLMNTRISDGLAGKLSTKTVGEILDEEIAEARA